MKPVSLPTAPLEYNSITQSPLVLREKKWEHEIRSETFTFACTRALSCLCSVFLSVHSLLDYSPYVKKNNQPRIHLKVWFMNQGFVVLGDYSCQRQTAAPQCVWITIISLILFSVCAFKVAASLTLLLFCAAAQSHLKQRQLDSWVFLSHKWQ